MTTTENFRLQLEAMRAELPTVANADLDLFAASAAAKAEQLRGALWTPKARADGLALAAEFEALASEAEKRIYPWGA